MTEQLKLKLNDSKATRWGALVIVAFTMMAAYYVNDVVAPLKTMLETDLAWSSTDFGFFTGGYSFLNVFFLMLIWGGLILDRFGIRFTGKLATILMVGGTALEYYAMTGLAGADATLFGINEIFGYKTGVFVAFAGYSIFGVGAEVAGITVSKIIAKWFKGKELATAMGVQYTQQCYQPETGIDQNILHILKRELLFLIFRTGSNGSSFHLFVQLLVHHCKDEESNHTAQQQNQTQQHRCGNTESAGQRNGYGITGLRTDTC